MLRHIIITIFLLCYVGLAFSQRNPVLDNFSLFNNNGKIFLSWTIASGSTCNGIQILRSVDGKQFYEIGNIAGVCGNSSSPSQYDFTDTTPVKNSINYYRLELGGSGSSQILSVEIIDITNGGYQIRSNPIRTSAKIYFDNNSKKLHQLLLFNTTGLHTITLSSKEDFFLLNSSNFINGCYVFTILDSENTMKAKGKFIIQH